MPVSIAGNKWRNGLGLLNRYQRPQAGIGHKNGFSLIEILVVLSIMVLVLAITPLMFPNVLAKIQAKAAARELISGLKYSRSRAIISQKEIALELDVADKYYEINGDRRKIVLHEDTILTLIAVKSEQLSESVGRIRFFPDGSSTGGEIIVEHRANKYTIRVNWLTGKVRIQS